MHIARGAVAIKETGQINFPDFAALDDFFYGYDMRLKPMIVGRVAGNLVIEGEAEQLLNLARGGKHGLLN